jgi:hypothetical protein
MKTVHIYHHLTSATLASAQVQDDDPTPIRTALEHAVNQGANLAGAYLAGAILAGVNLADADLTGARLSGADLTGADLTGARLAGADLTGARLAGASLTDADFTGALLSGADLAYTRLAGAILTYARLSGADLAGADLADIRVDLETVLAASPNEVPALLAALTAGNVNGSVYDGPCACLVGTLANARGCRHDAIPGLKPDSTRPAERWFLAIQKGHTPATNPVSALTAEWVRDWLARLPHSP